MRSLGILLKQQLRPWSHTSRVQIIALSLTSSKTKLSMLVSLLVAGAKYRHLQLMKERFNLAQDLGFQFMAG